MATHRGKSHDNLQNKSSTFFGSLQLGSDLSEILRISIAKISYLFLKRLFICIARSKGTSGRALVPLIVKGLPSKSLS